MHTISEVESKLHSEQQNFHSAETQLKQELTRVKQENKKNAELARRRQSEGQKAAAMAKNKETSMQREMREAREALERQVVLQKSQASKDAAAINKLKAKLEKQANDAENKRLAAEKEVADRAAKEAKAAFDADWSRADFDFMVRLRQLGINSTCTPPLSPDVSLFETTFSVS